MNRITVPQLRMYLERWHDLDERREDERREVESRRDESRNRGEYR